MTSAQPPTIPTAARTPTTVVFDLGGVLILWEPALAFADVLEPHEIEPFEEVGFEEWNLAQDRGRSLTEGVSELTARLPHRAAEMAAYERGWRLSLSGELPESVAVLDELDRLRRRQAGQRRGGHRPGAAEAGLHRRPEPARRPAPARAARPGADVHRRRERHGHRLDWRPPRDARAEGHDRAHPGHPAVR